MTPGLHGLIVAALAAAIAMVGVGCKSKTSPSPDTNAVASAAASAVAPVASASAAGKTSHCPTAVDGSTTAIVDVDGGVQLTVTVPTADAVADVRARARFLSDAAKSTTSTVRHTGRGEGGGIGRCPVVMRDTLIDVVDVDQGARMVVHPKDAAQLDWLRRETRERYEDEGEDAPASSGAGAGKRRAGTQR